MNEEHLALLKERVTKLNRLADEATARIAKMEKFLQETNTGTSLWMSFEDHEVGHAKHNGIWRIMIQRQATDPHEVGYCYPALECPREARLLVARNLDRFVAEISNKVAELLSKYAP